MKRRLYLTLVILAWIAAVALFNVFVRTDRTFHVPGPSNTDLLEAHERDHQR